jgi:hypothetical protein
VDADRRFVQARHRADLARRAVAEVAQHEHGALTPVETIDGRGDAAGLFLGIALGASYEWESRGRMLPTLVSRNSLGSRGAHLAPVPSRGAGDGAADEAFMMELETALDRPHTRELAAFDAFTPHFREIKDQQR